jgi:G3E family GTPase
VRGDLIRIIEGLLKHRSKFDAILVETTGLADPAPVAQTFFADADVSEAAKLDAVVTVADAKWLGERLKDAPEAKNQIAFADVIILNKTDLVDAKQAAEIEARIRAINPYAALHKTVSCAVPLDAVLGRNAFDLKRILEISPDFLSGEEDGGHHDGHEHRAPLGLRHSHDEEIHAVSLSAEADIDPDKFMPWLQNFVQTEGASILRAKGIVAFKGEPRRFVFQGVHMLLDGDLQRAWRLNEKRFSRLVFIGRKLNEDDVSRGFLSCLA